MKRGLLALALVFGLATPALAHRGHAGLTVIEVSPEGAVSVVHRFSAHDVEPALISIAPDAQPSLDDPAALAALETHLAERFRLDIDGAPLPVTRTETRLAGDQVEVAFGGAARSGAADNIRRVTVDLDFFPGVHDDQEQQVNVRLNGVTRTVVFRPGSQAQTLSFPAS